MSLVEFVFFSIRFLASCLTDSFSLTVSDWFSNKLYNVTTYKCKFWTQPYLWALKRFGYLRKRTQFCNLLLSLTEMITLRSVHVQYSTQKYKEISTRNQNSQGGLGTGFHFWMTNWDNLCTTTTLRSDNQNKNSTYLLLILL